MQKIDYKEAVLLSCHMNFKSEVMQRTSFEILKLLLDMGSLAHDIFLVQSDEAKARKKTEGKDVLQEVDDGIYRVVKIESGLNTFYDCNWIFCLKLTTEAQIRSLITAERGVHIYNFYGASDRANKLIKNLSMSEKNCFFLTDPDDTSEYSVIGNDALFKYLVQELPDHKNYAPERGDTGHWTAKGKFFFPLRLKKEDRINALLKVSPKNKKCSYPSNIRLHRTNQYRKSPGFPARPIDLRTIRQRYGDHPVLAEVALHAGAEWLIDEKNVAHLRFFTSPEIVDETQELIDMREDMAANCSEIDNQTTLAIAQFHESGDRICVLLSGPKAGAVAILSLDSDDAILFESFKEFIASLDADAVALLRKFGVADVVVDGKTVKPYEA